MLPWTLPETVCPQPELDGFSTATRPWRRGLACGAATLIASFPDPWERALPVPTTTGCALPVGRLAAQRRPHLPATRHYRNIIVSGRRRASFRWHADRPVAMPGATPHLAASGWG